MSGHSVDCNKTKFGGLCDCGRPGSYPDKEKKYIVELEGRVQSFEVPVYAKSLDEATLKSQEYEDAGFVVGRVRPELHD